MRSPIAVCAGVAGAMAAAGLALAGDTTSRAPPGHVAVEPGARPPRLGDREVSSPHDGDVVRANEGGTFGLGFGAAEVEAVPRAEGAPTGVIPMSHGAPLIKGAGC